MTFISFSIFSLLFCTNFAPKTIVSGAAQLNAENEQNHVVVNNVHDENAHRQNPRRLKVLVHTWTSAYSHLQFQMAVADALAEAGHEVHILRIDSTTQWNDTLHSKGATKVFRTPVDERPSMLEKDVSKMKIASGMFAAAAQRHSMDYQFAHNEWEAFEEILQGMQMMCQKLLSSKKLLAELRAEKYDVALAESFDECIYGVFYAIGVRTRCCATLAIPPNQWNLWRFGLPTIPSYMTEFMAPQSNVPNLNFIQRAINLYNTIYQSLFLHGENVDRVQNLFREILGETNFPSLDELTRNQSLMFVNSNEVFDLPRPTSSKIIPIGGIVYGDEKNGEIAWRSNKSLTIKRLLDESDAGAVLVSFGSIIDTREIPVALKRGMLKAFAQFPRFRFIWKFSRNESDSSENALFAATPNVHAEGWIEQKAVLGHAKTRGFVTHCGQNSANEAARAGVPVVAVPLFGDQVPNAANLRHKGSAVVVDIRALLKDDDSAENILAAALRDILYETNYLARAKLLQRKLATTPFSPQERLVRWVEFAAQFHDLAELNLPRVEDVGGFLQYYSLDVLGVVAAVAFTAFWIVWKLLKIVLKHTIIPILRANFTPKASNEKIKCS